jgi:hypothetical protein
MAVSTVLADVGSTAIALTRGLDGVASRAARSSCAEHFESSVIYDVDHREARACIGTRPT